MNGVDSLLDDYSPSGEWLPEWRAERLLGAALVSGELECVIDRILEMFK
jgi:hypothetical protein